MINFLIFSFKYPPQEDPTVDNLQKIANDCTEHEIGIVMINDIDEAKSYGLEDKMPAILYFENKVIRTFCFTSEFFLWL